MAAGGEQRKAEIVDALATQLGIGCRATRRNSPSASSARTSATWRRTTWPSAIRWTSTARPWPSCASARIAGRARPKSGSTTPSRAERLAVDPHRGRGRQRRHAVPGRQPLDRARAASPGHPSRHPSGAGGPRDPEGRLLDLGRRREVGNGLRESFIHVEVDRQSDPATARAARAGPAARARGRAAWRSPTGARCRTRSATSWPSSTPAPPVTRDRRGAGGSPRRSCTGWPTGISPCSATMPTRWRKMPTACSSAARRARHWESCASTTMVRCRRAFRPCRPISAPGRGSRHRS